MRNTARGAVRLFLFLVALVLAGCASTANQKWNSRVGSYTVTQALAELGRPQKVVTYPDGVQVAEWLTRFGTRTSLMAQSGPTFAARSFDYSVLPRDGVQIPDKYLRLLFGADGKLIAWDRPYR